MCRSRDHGGRRCPRCQGVPRQRSDRLRRRAKNARVWVSQQTLGYRWTEARSWHIITGTREPEPPRTHTETSREVWVTDHTAAVTDDLILVDTATGERIPASDVTPTGTMAGLIVCEGGRTVRAIKPPRRGLPDLALRDERFAQARASLLDSIRAEYETATAPETDPTIDGLEAAEARVQDAQRRYAVAAAVAHEMSESQWLEHAAEIDPDIQMAPLPLLAVWRDHAEAFSVTPAIRVIDRRRALMLIARMDRAMAGVTARAQDPAIAAA